MLINSLRKSIKNWLFDKPFYNSVMLIPLSSAISLADNASSINGINYESACNALNTLKRLFTHAEPELVHVRMLKYRVTTIFQDVEKAKNESERADTEPQAKITLNKYSSETRLLKKRNYDEIVLLGEGMFGSVWKARYKIDGQFYAIKYIKQKASPSSKAAFSAAVSMTRTNDAEIQLKELLHELHLLVQLTHPNIVNYYDSFIETHESTQWCCIRMKLCDQSLENWLESEKKNWGDFMLNSPTHIKCLALSNTRTRIIVDILQGLQYIHERGIVHGDLHIGNVFLDNTADGLLAAIGDFGQSGSEPCFENRESFTQFTDQIWRTNVNTSQFKTSRPRHRSFLLSKSHSAAYDMHCFGEVYFHIRYLQMFCFDNPKHKAIALSADYRLQADVDLIKDLIQDSQQIRSQCKNILQLTEFKIFTRLTKEITKNNSRLSIKQLCENFVVPLVEKIKVTSNQIYLPLDICRNNLPIIVATAEKHNDELYLLIEIHRYFLLSYEYIIQKIGMENNCEATVIYEEKPGVPLAGLHLWNSHIVTLRNNIELLFIDMVKHNATHLFLITHITQHITYSSFPADQVITCKGPKSTIFLIYLRHFPMSWKHAICAVDLSDVFVSESGGKPVETEHIDSRRLFKKNLRDAKDVVEWDYFPFNPRASFYLYSECELLVASSSTHEPFQTRIDAYSYLPEEGFKGQPTLLFDFQSAFYRPHLVHCQKLLLYFPEINSPDEERELHARHTRQGIAEVPICMRTCDCKFACWVENREEPIAPVAIGAVSAGATMANERGKTDILCSSEVFYIAVKDLFNYELHKQRICHLESHDRL